MSIDAELEVAIYMHNFHNLDLFQQGWYGIKLTCFWEKDTSFQKLGRPSRVLQYAVHTDRDNEALSCWQINDADSSYRTRQFPIRYSRQNVPLHELVAFHLKLHQNAPMSDAVVVQFDLLFAPLEKEVVKNVPPVEMATVSSHAFRIVGGAWHGQHAYFPVTFDSLHFVHLDVSFHLVLLSVKSAALLPPDSSTGGENGQEAASELPNSIASDAIEKTKNGENDTSLESGDNIAPDFQEMNIAEVPSGKGVDEVTKEVSITTEEINSPELADTDNWMAENEPKQIVVPPLQSPDSPAPAGIGGQALAENMDPAGHPSRQSLELMRLLLEAQRELTQALCSFTKSLNVSEEFEIPEATPSSFAQRLEKVLSPWEQEWPAAVTAGGIDDETEHQAGLAGDGSSPITAPGSNTSNLVQTNEPATVSSPLLQTKGVQLSQEECLEERQSLVAQMSSLWSMFLYLHRGHHAEICQILREEWEKGRAAETAMWVVGTQLCIELDADMYGLEGGDWVGPWRRNTLSKKQQEERAMNSAQRADLYRKGLTLSQCKNFKVQDLQLFNDPAVQPIIFVEHHDASMKGMEPIDTPIAGGVAAYVPSGGTAGASGTLKAPSPLPDAIRKGGKHVVVFVHGFQGHHLDLRLVKNHWLVLDPELECIMAQANEDRTFDSIGAMGARLADEVSSQLNAMFNTRHRRGALRRLSFVGHSVGNLIIRAALTDEAMGPYMQYLHTFLSISGPHLGYLYSSNTVFNGGLWVLKRLNKGAQVMHELTFSDHTDIRQTYLYRLSQEKTLEHFKHVILLSSPQDRYVPYHSARIELCPAAMRDSKKGTAYASMVQGCLGPLIKSLPSHSCSFIRCDVNFDTSGQPRNFNNFIGRTAHIDFLETDAYIRFLLWSYWDCFA